jgi:hypothetical protein
MNKADLCVARWALLLEEFSYIILYRPDKHMLHVDALGRYSLPTIFVIDESEESITMRLRTAQRKNNDLEKLFDTCEQKSLDNYVVKNGLLFKECDSNICLVMPKSMQLVQIAKRTHENDHFPSKKTEWLLQRDYWFPHMRSKVESVVKSCVSCIFSQEKRNTKSRKGCYMLSKRENICWILTIWIILDQFRRLRKQRIHGSSVYQFRKLGI